MDDVSRNVTVNYRVVNDPSNPATFNRTRSQAQAANESMYEDTVKLSEKQASAYEKGFQSAYRARAREADASKKTTDQMIADIDRRVAAQDKESINAAKNAQRAADTKIREDQKAARVHEQTIRQQVANDRFAERSMIGLVTGLGQITRGFLLMGLTGNESLEKIIRKFAVFEGGIQIFVGIIRTINSMERAMEAYRRASLGAAAAQEVLGAAKLGGAGAGAAQLGLDAATGTGLRGIIGRGIVGVGGSLSEIGGGSVAAGAGIVSGGAVAAAAAIASLNLWSEKLTGSTTAVDSFTRKVGDFLAGVTSTPINGGYGSKFSAHFQQESEDSFVHNLRASRPGGISETEIQNKLNEFRTSQNIDRLSSEMQARRELREFQRSGNTIRLEGQFEEFGLNRKEESYRAGRGLSGAVRDEAMNRAGRNTTSSFLDKMIADKDHSGIKNDDPQIQVEAYTKIRQLINEKIELEEKSYDIAKKRGEEELEAEKQRLADFKTLLSDARSELSQIRSQLGSNAERFLEADPFQRAKITAAARKAQSGQDLNWDEAKALRGFSGDVFSNAITNSALNTLRGVPGGDAILPRDLVNRQSTLRGQIDDLNVKIQREEQTINVKRATNDDEIKSVGAAISDIVVKMIEQDKQLLKDEIVAKVSADLQRKQEANDKAKDRGKGATP